MLNFALCRLRSIYVTNKKIERVIVVFITIQLLMDNRHIEYVPWGGNYTMSLHITAVMFSSALICSEQLVKNSVSAVELYSPCLT